MRVPARDGELAPLPVRELAKARARGDVAPGGRSSAAAAWWATAGAWATRPWRGAAFDDVDAVSLNQTDDSTIDATFNFSTRVAYKGNGAVAPYVLNGTLPAAFAAPANFMQAPFLVLMSAFVIGVIFLILSGFALYNRREAGGRCRNRCSSWLERVPETVYRVFVPRTGAKAHLDATCSGMRGPNLLEVPVALAPVLSWCTVCGRFWRTAPTFVRDVLVMKNGSWAAALRASFAAAGGATFNSPRPPSMWGVFGRDGRLPLAPPTGGVCGVRGICSLRGQISCSPPRSGCPASPAAFGICVVSTSAGAGVFFRPPPPVGARACGLLAARALCNRVQRGAVAPSLAARRSLWLKATVCIGCSLAPAAWGSARRLPVCACAQYAGADSGAVSKQNLGAYCAGCHHPARDARPPQHHHCCKHFVERAVRPDLEDLCSGYLPWTCSSYHLSQGTRLDIYSLSRSCWPRVGRLNAWTFVYILVNFLADFRLEFHETSQL